MVNARRVPDQPSTVEPDHAQPRADRHRPPVRPHSPRRGVRGRSRRGKPPGHSGQPRHRPHLADGRGTATRRRQPPDGRLGSGTHQGFGPPVLHRDDRPAERLPLRGQLQRQRGPDLASRLHRRQHARLVRRDGGPDGRHEPGQSQLRGDLPRLQLAEGRTAGRWPAGDRVAQLRAHVGGDRGPEAAGPERLSRRVAHRLQADHGA